MTLLNNAVLNGHKIIDVMAKEGVDVKAPFGDDRDILKLLLTHMVQVKAIQSCTTSK